MTEEDWMHAVEPRALEKSLRILVLALDDQLGGEVSFIANHHYHYHINPKPPAK